jgi:signal recognition particle subunit SRP68
MAAAVEENLENPNVLGEGTPEQAIFSLPLFQTLDQAQSFHGIPSQDYDQYHDYCTKRLSRIRHHKEVRTTLTHNPKFRSESGSSSGNNNSSSKKRHAYCPRAIPERIHHPLVLWNLLFQAERAWAAACAAQASQSKHATAQRRFNKAVKWAQQLEETLQRCGDEATQQEATAYLAWMRGNKALESKDYATAFRQYQQSRKSLFTLTLNLEGTDQVDQLALSDLWTTRADTVLKPLVRFCQYQAKDTLAAEEVAGLDIQAKGGSSSQKGESSRISLEFRNKVVGLEAYPQLAVLYLKIEGVLEDESSTAQKLDEKVFLQLLADLDDALGIVATENSRYAGLPAGPAVTAKRSELATLKCFFTFHKLQRQLEHQEDTLVDETEESDAGLYHFYDALQQNSQAVADLAVEGETEEDYNPEDDPHWLEAQAHVVRIRSYRCFYLARLYETDLNGTAEQVLALLQQARVLQRRAAEEIAACELDDDYLAGLQELKTKISTTVCRIEAGRYLELQGASTGIKTTNRPLWQRLDELDAGIVLADVPPLPIPLPCKPVFYDLAASHLSESIVIDALDDYIEENEPRKKSAGLFGSWF